MIARSQKVHFWKCCDSATASSTVDCFKPSYKKKLEKSARGAQPPPVACNESRDVVDHVTNRFAICHFLPVVHWNRASISNRRPFWRYSAQTHVNERQTNVTVATAYHKAQYSVPYTRLSTRSPTIHTLYYCTQSTHFITVIQSPFVCS